MAGRPLNIASPKQLQELLFGELKLPVVEEDRQDGAEHRRRGVGGACPAAPAAGQDSRIPAVCQAQEHLRGRLAGDDLPETGRVHASFNQVVAATGRLSSSDPNLQNIPVRTEEGREIRSAFVPGHEGWVLLAADYSQIELRVLAHFSGDARLCEAFARDEDIHARVASQVNGVPLDKVTPEMRRAAKAVNFGVIYGQSPFGLARVAGDRPGRGGEVHRQLFRGVSGHRGILGPGTGRMS